jgi:hypothetical protein
MNEVLMNPELEGTLLMWVGFFCGVIVSLLVMLVVRGLYLESEATRSREMWQQLEAQADCLERETEGQESQNI